MSAWYRRLESPGLLDGRPFYCRSRRQDVVVCSACPSTSSDWLSEYAGLWQYSFFRQRATSSAWDAASLDFLNIAARAAGDPASFCFIYSGQHSHRARSLLPTLTDQT